MIDYLIVLAGMILSYIAGSIPFGLIFTKIMTGRDLRDEGSGNIGATNTLRTAGFLLGFLVFICDGLKGFIPAIIGLCIGDMATLMFSFSAFMGHLFSVFLHFKGGKGVSIFIFILFALNYILGSIFIAVWLVVFILTRYVSLASLIGVLVTYIAMCVLATEYDTMISIATMLFTTTAVSLIILKHISNLYRLFSGTEYKFGRNKNN